MSVTIPVTSPYSYPQLTREETGTHRFYLHNGMKLPSVTTILGLTKSDEDKKALENWRLREGEEKAEKILQHSLTTGTAMHKNMEEYLLEGKLPSHGNLQTKLMSKLMMKLFNGKIDEVWGSEVALYFPELYAGSTDLVCVYKGEPAIVDFKNSRKMKKKEKMGDYWTQIAAYRHAHNEVYKTNITRSVILMVSQDFESQEFIVDADENNQYDDLWFGRLEKYLMAA